MSATEAEIYTAIYNEFTAITPAWNTKKLGIDFDPKGGGPWQRMTMLPTPEPDFAGFGNGRFTRGKRIVQFDLFYPKAEKRIDALFARAEAVRSRFWPTAHGRSIAAGDATLDITTEPVVSNLIDDGTSHNQVSVTVVFSTDRGPVG